MDAANTPVNVEALPAARCGGCTHWDAYKPTRRQAIPLGLCNLRPGALRTYTAPGAACTVRTGGAMAWKPMAGPA